MMLAAAEPAPLITDPTALLVFFLGFVACIFLAARTPRLLLTGAVWIGIDIALYGRCGSIAARFLFSVCHRQYGKR